jgi:hypothetical protein
VCCFNSVLRLECIFPSEPADLPVGLFFDVIQMTPRIIPLALLAIKSRAAHYLTRGAVRDHGVALRRRGIN